MMYIKAFVVGGIICVIAQLLMDKTKLMPARIVVLYVCLGAIFTLFGFYDKMVDFAGAGVTVPITGFGYALARGVMEEVQLRGFTGIFTGGLKATAGGVTAAILFGYFAAIIFNPKPK